jgi:hypothetical protein
MRRPHAGDDGDEAGARHTDTTVCTPGTPGTPGTRPGRLLIMENGAMAGDASDIVLSKQELREVTAFAAVSAEAVLEIFEADQPDDPRPRDAVRAAWEFARGGERGRSLRDTASAALKAAKSAETAAELVAGDDHRACAAFLEQVVRRVTPVVVDVLERFPVAPTEVGASGS